MFPEPTAFGVSEMSFEVKGKGGLSRVEIEIENKGGRDALGRKWLCIFGRRLQVTQENN